MITVCGTDCIIPFKIAALELYTDNSSCLAWIRSYSETFEKLNGKSVFVRNRLAQIYRVAEKLPISIKYGFCIGAVNPADATTRPMSYKLMMQAGYLSGVQPEVADDQAFPPVLVPPMVVSKSIQTGAVSVQKEIICEPVFDFTRVSKFSKLCSQAHIRGI